jgi:hypothetical protein
MARSEHAASRRLRPLSQEERTHAGWSLRAGYDPLRTLPHRSDCVAQLSRGACRMRSYSGKNRGSCLPQALMKCGQARHHLWNILAWLFRLYVGCPDDLGPFLGFRLDQRLILCRTRRDRRLREWHRRNSSAGNARRSRNAPIRLDLPEAFEPMSTFSGWELQCVRAGANDRNRQA